MTAAKSAGHMEAHLVTMGSGYSVKRRVEGANVITLVVAIVNHSFGTFPYRLQTVMICYFKGKYM